MFYSNNIGMVYFILPNLQLVFFYIYLLIERFKKIYMLCLIINNIIVYRTIIIINILNKVVDCIKFGVVKNWSK